MRSIALTTRLAVFFTLVAATVVIGLASLLMVAIDGHFLELDRRVLADKTRLTHSIILEATSAQELRRRLSRALNDHQGLFVQVSDQTGRNLYTTEGFEPPDAASASTRATPDSAIRRWQAGDRSLHAVRSRVDASMDELGTMSVLVAVDSTHHERFLNELSNTIVRYSILATLISGLLGWLAARQGLAPLRAMKAKAADVTAQQLGQRMPVEAVPVEVANLAHALNQMLDRLREEFTRLSDFSSNLAHELRTPISNLMTQTGVALSQTRDADTYRRILESNVEEFQRLARTVSDMLYLAKTERTDNVLAYERFSAAQEVRALFEYYEAVAEGMNISLTVQGDADIEGDRLMIRRAVGNLLSNALRYGEPGGEVKVEIGASPEAVEVTVENTGEAISPDLLPRLFDRFYRADSSRARPESEGSGLGLSITKAILEAHGGDVRVHSEGGRTRFTLKFPRRPARTTPRRIPT